MITTAHPYSTARRVTRVNLWQAEPMETPRLLFVHAHPDDETLTTGAHHRPLRRPRRAACRSSPARSARRARSSASGGRSWPSTRADQLGGYRIGELTAALAALGVDEPSFLGGAGPLARLGHGGHAAAAPAAVRRRRPRARPSARSSRSSASCARTSSSPTTRTAGYGHPDHIHAHRVTTAAVAAAAAPTIRASRGRCRSSTGRCMSTARHRRRARADSATCRRTGSGSTRRRRSDSAIADDEIDAVVDAPEQRAGQGGGAARARHPGHRRARRPVAARCRTTSRCRSAARSTTSWPRATPGERDDRGWETDLLAGLEPRIATARRGTLPTQSAARRKGRPWTRIWIPTCSTGRTAWTTSSGWSVRSCRVLDSIPT